MKPNLNRFSAILLFACVAIICSLTMWATVHPGHDTAADTGKTPAPSGPFTFTGGNQPAGNFIACVGDSRVYITGSFAVAYSCVNLNTVPGVPFGWGGLILSMTIRTRYSWAAMRTVNGRIYQIGVTRDADNADHRLYRNRDRVSDCKRDDRL